MRALRHLAAALAWLVGCTVSEPVPQNPPLAAKNAGAARVRALRASENARRARYSPHETPAWLDVSGADPYRLSRWRQDGAEQSTPDFVGILRGSKALVALNSDLVEVDRVAMPESPTALCAWPGRRALVASRFSPEMVLVGPSAEGGLRELARWRVNAVGVADVACDVGELAYALTTDPPAIVVLDGRGREVGRVAAMPGGLRLKKRGQYLLETSLFERALRVVELDRRGLPVGETARVRHDGPLWAFDAIARGRELLVAVAGVEDEPLVRDHGEFENIDSFAWLYRVTGSVERVAELNLGEHGLVLPKSIALTEQSGTLTLSALASGSGALLRARFDAQHRAVSVDVEPVPPGGTDALFLGRSDVVYASPLLDAWISAGGRGVVIVPVDPSRRPEPQVRLGEALFFTELIAPENVSTGRHSRFSCETCHFEGGVDGRTHHTGRGDVRVVTKSLFGLANNRPHFSRALDPDLSAVSHNEFRVAGAGSGSDPWFELSASRFPWLRPLGVDRAELSALELREALVGFLYAFTHEPNPRASGRARFSALEARGALDFERLCEHCHTARSLADDPRSRVPIEQWEAQIFRRNAALVWARSEREKTGIVPYVHDRGTRITSLRRLHLRPRYFTNGSAATLADVLAEFRLQSGRAWHRAPSRDGVELELLDQPTRAALLAFLRLL